MAAGRPIVATLVDESFPIKESGAGIVTPVEPEAMAEAVVKLLDDRPLCERLVLKGVEYAARLDWERMVAEYVRVLWEAASHGCQAAFIRLLLNLHYCCSNVFGIGDETL